MVIVHVALVPEYPGFDPRLVSRVASALQKQITRDVAPIWEVNATVDAFEHLEDMPVGYWPIIVTTRDLGGQDGTHLDSAGAPYALVEARPMWSLVASHECIEMILDPFGNRTIAGRSPREDQHRAEFLLEVCDPCQSADTAYTVNDILVSDFVTPDYFHPVPDPRGRYSYSGKIDAPHGLLVDGYLSWRDATTGRWWQRARTGDSHDDRDLGPLDVKIREARSLREMLNVTTQHHARIGKSVTAEQAARAAKEKRARHRAGSLRANAIREHVRSLPPIAATSQTFEAPTPRKIAVAQEIDRGIAELAKKPSKLPDVDRVLDVLKKAKQQWAQLCEQWKGDLPPKGALPVEYAELAITLGALERPRIAPSKSLLTGRSIFGFSQYEDGDVFHWGATVWNDIFRSKVPFAVASPASVVVHPLQRQCTIAIAGDWGTGNASSKQIAGWIDSVNATYTIHLGDVYYSGTEGEEMDNFVSLWPTGTIASFTLNSNHEMYSGGNGYFHVALQHPKFETQGGYSYFALANDDWVILGLDSAYEATGFYQTGALNQAQVDWIKQLEADGLFNRKKTMVLTHHEGIDTGSGTKKDALWNAVTQALGGVPDYWYWGHEHAVAVFDPAQTGGARCRLVGHGGVPYRSDGIKPFMQWAEDPNDQVLVDGIRRSRNGHAVLKFDGPNVVEELFDEFGQRRWCSAAI